MDRLLAREGLSAEQLARDLKTFELKVFLLWVQKKIKEELPWNFCGLLACGI